MSFCYAINPCRLNFQRYHAIADRYTIWVQHTIHIVGNTLHPISIGGDAYIHTHRKFVILASESLTRYLASRRIELSGENANLPRVSGPVETLRNEIETTRCESSRKTKIPIWPIEFHIFIGISNRFGRYVDERILVWIYLYINDLTSMWHITHL